MDASLRSKLESEIMPGRWADLLYQFARGGLLVLDSGHDLLNVASAIACDHSDEVARLLASGELRRATDSDARTFQATPERRFQFVIVQPWVLAQPL